MTGAGVSTSEGASNPEYVTARVRSRRASLFGEEDYRKLVRMSPSEIANYMEETVYRREIDDLGARHSGVDLIEYALNANLAANFDDLLRWADGPLYDRIASYLRKFDAWNLKTIFRGLYSGAGRDAIADDLVRAGTLDDDLLERLIDAGTVENAVELLDGTVFEKPLAAAFEDFEDSGLLMPIENAIDRAYYEHLLEGVDDEGAAVALYEEFLTAEIDFRNARNALRIARSGADIDPAEYFIDGGDLFEESTIARLAGNRDELVTAIRESTYGEELDAALDDLESAESLIGFERALDRALLSYADHLSHVYPLSVCPVLAYVLAKEREVDNIRAIARGKEAGLDREAIEAELVTT
jgi:V/A-type H+-transporting ATPase subunit C